MNLFNDIKEFHEKFGLDYQGPPRQLDLELRVFRKDFMKEELTEYCQSDDLHGQLDALVDLVYVALGTAYMQGFDFNEAWRRVHEANMKKVRADRADQSKRGSTFDVVKPPGWTAPDLRDLVGEAGEAA
jgi:predicted HAD superfamily Cof-like phosphohydrolase